MAQSSAFDHKTCPTGLKSSNGSAAVRSQKEGEEAGSIDWGSAFPIGSTAAGEVADRKDYGILCDLAGHPDVVGLIVPEQVRRP